MNGSHDSRFYLVEAFELSHKVPSLSIVIPAFNQEKLIGGTLQALSRAITLPAELIIINDSSEDGTLTSILEWCHLHQKISDSKFTLVSVYATRRQVFETGCDNFGFELSRADFVLELQADIVLLEVGFDARMLRALGCRENLLALSGKGVEPFTSAFSMMIAKGGTTVSRGSTALTHVVNTLLAPARRVLNLALRKMLPSIPSRKREVGTTPSYEPFPTGQTFPVSKMAGSLSDVQLDSPPQDQIWIGETIMRGPNYVQ